MLYYIVLLFTVSLRLNTIFNVLLSVLRLINTFSIAYCTLSKTANLLNMLGLRQKTAIASFFIKT